MSPIPIASVTRAPQPCLEHRAERRLAAARLARHEHALDARVAEVEALGQVRGVRRSQHHRLRLEELDRLDQALGVPRADRDV